MAEKLDASAAETPHPSTVPCRACFLESTGFIQLLGFVSSLVIIAEHVGSDDLVAHEHGPPELKLVVDGLKVSGGSTEVLRYHSRRLWEMLYIRAVDNYQTYLADLLGLVFRNNPETLRTEATERLDFILAHESMDDLIDSLAEKRVRTLTYRSIEDLADDLRSRYSFELFETPAQQRKVELIIANRNAFVHNRAIANSVYLTVAKRTDVKVGEQIPLRYDLLWEHWLALCRVAKETDARAVEKFHLPVVD